MVCKGKTVSLCLPGAYNLVKRERKQIYNMIREMPRMKNKILEEGIKTLTGNVDNHFNIDIWAES